MWHVSGRVEVHTGFLWEYQKTKDYLENPGEDARIILKWICKK
jgi:hypothetical protein